MHEKGMVERLLATTLRQAAARGARRVTALHIVAGELAAVSTDSVQFYWDEVSAGTLAEGARLKVEQQPAQLVCQACHATYDLGHGLERCPRCRSDQLRLAAGADLILASMEVEAEAVTPNRLEAEAAEVGPS